MINKAFEIARHAHAGQVDKGGNPYILHPVRVALNCQTAEEKIVALLHDVVEDTPVTLEELQRQGFSREVIEAVHCLTKEPGEDYDAFIKRVATNPIATRVKIQDLKDNMDTTRLGGRKHWKLETYQAALDYLMKTLGKKILYVDMDNVLVDFQSGIHALSQEIQTKYAGHYDSVPGIFAKMCPMPDAIETLEALKDKYDIYILSTAPWNNPTAWSDKLIWVKQYLGKYFHKRLILSHHKDLNQGDYLIDDRLRNGAGQFQGELIQFGTPAFPDWKSVQKYLLQNERL